VIKSKTFDSSLSGQRRSSNSSQDSGLNESSLLEGEISWYLLHQSSSRLSIDCYINYSPRSTSLNDFDGGEKWSKINVDFVHSFTVEELMLAAYEARLPSCSFHGPLTLSSIAPDIVIDHLSNFSYENIGQHKSQVFLDLNPTQLVQPEQVKRTKMLGRGAFGFVFKASVKFRGQIGSQSPTDVALKMLQPVDPGFSAKQSALCAFKV